MAEIVHEANQQKPVGVYLDTVQISPEEAMAIPLDGLYGRTAEAFERVRKYIPIGGSPYGISLIDRIDARLQRWLRHRERRPIQILDNESPYYLYDHSDTMVSPAAQLTDGTGTYCIAVEGEAQPFFGPSNTPYVAMLDSEARSSMRLQSSKLSIIDAAREGPFVFRYTLEDVGSSIDPRTPLSTVQRLGLGAVCLALERSY